MNKTTKKQRDEWTEYAKTLVKLSVLGSCDNFFPAIVAVMKKYSISADSAKTAVAKACRQKRHEALK